MRLISTLIFILGFSSIAIADSGNAIQQAVNAKHRSVENVARDQYRHPAETLAFFGIEPNMSVLEILPGRGWYTEILAPLLKEQGKLTIAHFGSNNPNEYLRGIYLNHVSLLEANSDIYGEVKVVDFQDGDNYLEIIPDNSQDMVVTFRSAHNWIRYGGIEKIYPAIYRVLKKGGILGVVQHRASDEDDYTQSAEKGYVPEPYLIKLLEDIGFELVEKSEINANPNDLRNHPDGVWSLPPSLRTKGKEAEFLAIGESDRMTLRFIKL